MFRSRLCEGSMDSARPSRLPGLAGTSERGLLLVSRVSGGVVLLSSWSKSRSSSGTCSRGKNGSCSLVLGLAAERSWVDSVAAV